LIGSLVLAAGGVGAGCGGTEQPADTPVMVGAGPSADELDPALASSPAARQAVWLAYTPLLTYRHAANEKGAELIAGLASDLPDVSADGLEWTLRLRDELEYSDGSPVRASDFEHAIARTLAMRSPGAGLYAPIAGAPAFESAGDPAGDIAGIEADDETREIRITLTSADPDFADALALPYAAPVPGRTPARDLSTDPPPGVGPYELEAPAADGSFALRRNETFADLDIPDIPTGNLAEIRTVDTPGPARQAQDVLDGKLDYMQGDPPAALEPTISEQASDRLLEDGLPATVLFELAGDRPPFDDPLVREAVNRAVDRGRLAEEHGAMVAGCALLAPGVPGYDQQLDTSDCPYGNPEGDPDISSARALVHQAGAEGARVTVARGGGPARMVRTYARELAAIGLRPALVSTPAGAATRLRTIAPEFPRALDFLRALTPTDPLATAELARLGAPDELDPDLDQIRELDRYLVSPPQSYFAAIGHPSKTTLLSERIDPKSSVLNPLFGADYSLWLLKEGES